MSISATATDPTQVVIQRLAINDNDFSLLIEADLDDGVSVLVPYTKANLRYNVTIDYAVPGRLLKSLSAAPVTFRLPAECYIKDEDIPFSAFNIPVYALACTRESKAIRVLLGMVFSHCVATGRLVLAEQLHDIACMAPDVQQVLDIAIPNSATMVHMRYNVRNFSLRVQRLTFVDQITPTKRMSETVPTSEVWPYADRIAYERLYALAHMVMALGTGNPKQWTTCKRKDLPDSVEVGEHFLALWNALGWKASLECLVKVAKAINPDIVLSADNIGPYEALMSRNAVVFFPDLSV